LKMALSELMAASAEAADINGVSTAGQKSAEPISLGEALLSGGFELHPNLGGTSEGSRIEGIPSAASAHTSKGYGMVAVSVEDSPSTSDEDCESDYC